MSNAHLFQASEDRRMKPELPPEQRAAIEYYHELMGKNETCHFTPEEQQTVKHLNGVYDNLGDGDPSKGIEVHRETTKHVMRVLEYGDDAKKYTWITAIVGLMSWLAYAIWAAFKADVRG